MEIVVLGGNISESLTHCHPELVSGSTFMADEMLKQVQHDNFTYFLRILVKDSESTCSLAIIKLVIARKHDEAIPIC